MTFVLDASVVLAWVLDEDHLANTEAILDSLEVHEARAPSIWPLELANALVFVERRKRLTRAEIDALLPSLAKLRVEVERQERSIVLGPVLDLARDQGLSVYDATYLELALRLRLPLATVDKPLRDE